MIHQPVSQRRPPLSLLLLVLLLLSSCAGPQSTPRPGTAVPMERPKTSVPMERPETPVPGKPSASSIQTGPARSLHTQANAALASGHAGQAEMLLERALRLEPRNALYWHLLAQSKYAQGDFGQAVQFCRKSESLAGNNTQLKEYNKSLLQKANKKLGDASQAEKSNQ